MKSSLYLTTPRTQSTDGKDRQYIVQKALDESSESQLWKPAFKVKDANSKPNPDEKTSEGYLGSKAASNQLMSVDGGKAEEGKGIILWQGTEDNQKWSFEPTGNNGEYVIKNLTTQMVISAVDTAENSQLVQKNRTDSDDKQVWAFETAGSGKDAGYRIKNKGTNFYITAENVKNLAKVCQKKLDETATLQVWLTDAEITASEGAEITQPKGVDHLVSDAGNGQYLSVSGGSVKEGEELATWTGPEDNQRWKFQETSTDSGEYYIVSTNSNKAISAQNMLEGKRLVQKDIVSGDDKQIWSFVKTTKEGSYRLKNKATHLYLTADVSASGSRILQKNLMDSPLQTWSMEEKTDVKSITDTDDCVIKIWIKEGVTVTSSQGAAVTKGESVTFTLTPRDGYKVENMQFFINGEKQTLTDGAGGVKTCTVSGASEDMTVKAEADVTCLDGYVYIPENDYTGRNQCLSPRVVEGLDGTLYATFENGIPSEIEEGEYSFPVYESKDKGDTWKRVGEIINDDTVHPDSYYKITKYTDVGAPSEATEVTKDTEGAIRHPWSLQCCPQLFVLPEDQGDLKKGTLVCAGVAVPLEEGAETVSDAGYGGLWDSSLDFYYSTDGGRNWTFKSIIAEGGDNGRNIMGYDPVWEPFFLYHEKNLICYYSDETDPAHAQKLVYKITTDGGSTWGDAVDIVSINNKGARPGMPIVTELENGDWMMVYETVGMTSPIKSGVKIAKDPYNWNPSEAGPTLPDIKGTFGGSPYVFTLKDKRVVVGTGSLSEVFVNSRNDGTGEWIAKETGAPAGYNRCFFQLSTGEFFITGTEGPGFASQGNKIFVKRVWADEVPGDENNEYAVQVDFREAEGSVKHEADGVWNDIARGETVRIAQDSSHKFKIIPAEGYEIADVKLGKDSVLENVEIDGQGAGNYTLEGITADTALTVEFKAKDSAYRIIPGVNGTITADKETASVGEEVTFTFTPNAEYKIEDVLVNDESVLAKVKVDADSGVGTLKLAVKEDMIISAKFSKTKAPEATLERIEVTVPSKTEYKTGEKLDLTGMKVVAVYSDGSRIDVTGKVKTEGFDSSTVGKKTVTVTFEGKKSRFTVTVNQES